MEEQWKMMKHDENQLQKMKQTIHDGKIREVVKQTYEESINNMSSTMKHDVT